VRSNEKERNREDRHDVEPIEFPPSMADSYREWRGAVKLIL